MPKVRKEDTYEVRRAEGRPKHSNGSLSLLGTGVACWFLSIICIILPEWRSNWYGTMMYPHRRGWGLFWVTGMTTKMHHDVFTDTCRFFQQLTIGGVCVSPICLHYRTKCQVNMVMFGVNYLTGLMMIGAQIIHTLCIVWTLRMTPRLLRWASVWWCLCLCLHVSAVSFWMIMTTTEFQELDADAVYPEPDFSFSFYLWLLVCIGLMTCCVLGCIMKKTWPEESDTEDSDDDDDSDDSDDDGAFLKGKGPPGKGFKGPPPGKGMKGPPGPPEDFGALPPGGHYSSDGMPPGWSPPPGSGGPPPPSMEGKGGQSW